MSMTFAGRVAVVTGAGAGIGRATALAFAEQGLTVVVSDVDVAGGEATVRQIETAGGTAVFVRCDVTQEADVQHLMEQTISAFGRLDYALTMLGSKLSTDAWQTARWTCSTRSWRSTLKACGCA